MVSTSFLEWKSKSLIVIITVKYFGTIISYNIAYIKIIISRVLVSMCFLVEGEGVGAVT